MIFIIISHSDLLTCSDQPHRVDLSDSHGLKSRRPWWFFAMQALLSHVKADMSVLTVLGKNEYLQICGRETFKTSEQQLGREGGTLDI